MQIIDRRQVHRGDSVRTPLGYGTTGMLPSRGRVVRSERIFKPFSRHKESVGAIQGPLSSIWG